MKCLICESPTRNIFSHLVLRKYDVKYFKCDNCGFTFTPKPHWLEEAYSSAISNTDVGLVQRNIELSKKISTINYFFNGKDKNYLDYAGGTGLFVRLMRDIGFHYFWKDKFCQNVHANGFEYSNQHCEAVSAFEVLEHLEDPMSFFNEMYSNINPSCFIFSTEVYQGDDPPAPGDWWYYSFLTGQHISFYNFKTLKYIANKFNLNFYSSSGIHILAKRRLPKLFLWLILSRLNFLFYRYVKFRMTSLTLTDYQAALRELR
jgi:hypothetical protein